VSLNINDNRVGYCLGRLFAVLEKLQLDAHDGALETTIRDHYYCSASCTPKEVFITLIRLSADYMKKLDGKRRGLGLVVDNQLAEIIQHITEFPTSLDLHEQGLFAIGYYHQKQQLNSRGQFDQRPMLETARA